MKSPSTSITSGFTLFEVLLVLGLLTMVASFCMLAMSRSFDTSNITKERDLVVSFLTRARSHSMANDGGVAHGFCYDSANHWYEVFKTPYTNESIEERGTKSGTIDVSGVPDCGSGNEIIFTQLSGTTTPAEIDLSDADASSSIEINSEGTVLW